MESWCVGRGVECRVGESSLFWLTRCHDRTAKHTLQRAQTSLNAWSTRLAWAARRSCGTGGVRRSLRVGRKKEKEKRLIVCNLHFQTDDQVILLTTAADGAERFYTLENNEARHETPEQVRFLQFPRFSTCPFSFSRLLSSLPFFSHCNQTQAREIDARIAESWLGHAELRVIDNKTDFEGKMTRAVASVSCAYLCLWWLGASSTARKLTFDRALRSLSTLSR